MRDISADKEQVQLLKKWWQEYGRWIAVAVVIGLLASSGWRYWQGKQMQHKEQASNLYMTMQNSLAQQQTTQWQQQAEELKNHYSNTGYAVYAAFALAKQAADAGNYPAALQQLAWVKAHTNLPNYLAIATLRTAAIQLAQGHLEQALASVNAVQIEAFKPAVLELKGDIALAQKTPRKAADYYKEALKAFNMASINNPFLEMKLENVGG